MSLTDDTQQTIQTRLDFSPALTGEARKAGREGTESSGAMNGPESPASTDRLIEEVIERENLKEALRRVKGNKGSAGVDGMTIGDLTDYLRTQLLNGTYEPQPVRRVEIPQPDGGVRKLGIPTVLDRFIQQAVLQVLQRRWDRTFSPHSYGFRPGRSAHQAVAQAQQYVVGGYDWVVDLDLEKFFDRVNHDKLMGRVAQRIEDKRLLKLIRAFLNAGVMENGLVSPSVEGTPQGGPLSPLLSNLVLDELDRELERRGHRFVRYADDSNIYVRSERAGHRVMESITRFITNTLKLKVKETKSAVARPHPLGPIATTSRIVAAVENAAPPSGGAGGTRGRSATGQQHGRQRARSLVPCPVQGPLRGPVQCVLQIPRTSDVDRWVLA